MSKLDYVWEINLRTRQRCSFSKNMNLLDSWTYSYILDTPVLKSATIAEVETMERERERPGCGG